MLPNSRNPMKFLPIKNTVTPTITGKNILFPSVEHIGGKKMAINSQECLQPPYKRSSATPPSRDIPSCLKKCGGKSDKITPSSSGGLMPKKKVTQPKKYVGIYSKMKEQRNTEHFGVIQKPFEYNFSLMKKKNTSCNTRKTGFVDKRNSVMKNTSKEKLKKINEFDPYNLTLKNQPDLNKSADILLSTRSLNPQNNPKSIERVRRKQLGISNQKKSQQKPRKKSKRGLQKQCQKLTQIRHFISKKSSQKLHKFTVQNNKHGHKILPFSSAYSKPASSVKPGPKIPSLNIPVEKVPSQISQVSLNLTFTQKSFLDQTGSIKQNQKQKKKRKHDIGKNIRGARKNSTEKQCNNSFNHHFQSIYGEDTSNPEVFDIPDDLGIFKSELPKNTNPDTHQAIKADDLYEYIIDQEILDYVDSLRDKFNLSAIKTTKEFIDRINQELLNPDLNPKQFFALQELKREFLCDLEEPPIMNGDIDADQAFSIEDDEAQVLQKSAVRPVHKCQPEFIDYNFISTAQSHLQKGMISDQDFKTSIPQTPCFVSTPSNSQRASDAIAPCDLISALKRTPLNTLKASSLKCEIANKDLQRRKNFSFGKEY
ncbi:unnamed protein product [Moneuplotes crassus]|uniref:Uncharacterized protein n=1 Tax=Euplotes crassus TaxID=5936 RepID=A0AAD1U3M4_EUPCR|nr:unnamed protein product [Moneuplotes crassus]